MDEADSILIIDDDESTCRILTLLFGKKGYEVETAGTGRETLEKAQRRFFNLALLDIRLPDMDGIELITPLKKMHPDMAVIMVTAYASVETAARALKEGASAYITKPFNIDEVLVTVSEALEKQRLVMENKRLYQATMRELAERKQAEEALRQERNKVQKYLDVAGVMLVALDANQKVTLINKKGCEILRRKEEEIIGKNWFETFLPERVRDKAVAVFDKLMAGKTESAKYFESPVLTRTGGETFIAWHNTVLTDETGDIVGVLGSGEDITQRRLLTKKMVEYEELSSLKGSLLSTVSHELRTPLATIKGYSTMLLDYDRRLPDDEKREHLRAIDRATDRLTELIDHLLDMSRLEAGLLKLEKVPTNISKVIKEAAAEAEVRAPRHVIVADLRNRLPSVNIDAKRIRQVVDNILDNAIKYSEGGGRVVVQAQRAESELLVSIADQGIGIPAKELPSVFDRMYRIEQRLTPDIGGVGLGLAICKGLVEAHGGRIWVDSKVGQGSTFYFTLPIQTTAERQDYGKEA